MQPTPQRRGSFDELFDAIRALFTSNYAGLEPILVTVGARDKEGLPVTLTLPFPTGRTRPPPTDEEQRIIDTIGHDRMHAQKIARLTNAKYNSHFRDKLAAMVEKGLLRKVPGAYEVSF